MKKLLLRVYTGTGALPALQIAQHYAGPVPDYVDLIVEETDAGVDIRRERDPRADADRSIVLSNGMVIAVESADG
jgi:hypothetical protein